MGANSGRLLDGCAEVDALAGPRLLGGKYQMDIGPGAVLGEGSSCTCFRGWDVTSGAAVAIKVYKFGRCRGEALPGVTQASMLRQFSRQISVLRELGRSFTRPSDSRLWCEGLAEADPSDFFVQMLACSTGRDGKPGPDACDGMLYVITELAEESLEERIVQQLRSGNLFPRDTLRSLSRDLLHVVAGLHYKGFVHLDLKPENFMFFQGRLKLIDVDGCMRIGSTISPGDSSIAFSPVYCAPEWAAFVLGAHDPLRVVPGLDAWSVGAALYELATLDGLLASTYRSCCARGPSKRDGEGIFFTLLAELDEPPLECEAASCLDPDVRSLLAEHLLVCDPLHRASLAECLSHPFFAPSDPKQDGPRGSDIDNILASVLESGHPNTADDSSHLLCRL